MNWHERLSSGGHECCGMTTGVIRDRNNHPVWVIAMSSSEEGMIYLRVDKGPRDTDKDMVVFVHAQDLIRIVQTATMGNRTWEYRGQPVQPPESSIEGVR